MSTSVPEQSENTSQPWLSPKTANQYAKLQVADRASNLERIRNQSQSVLRLVRLTQDRLFGSKTTPHDGKADDMNIDSPTTYNITHGASSLGKLALAAAIGGPLGILAWKLPELLNRPEPTPVVQPETIHEPGTDRDWKLGEIVVE